MVTTVTLVGCCGTGSTDVLHLSMMDAGGDGAARWADEDDDDDDRMVKKSSEAILHASSDTSSCFIETR